MPRQPHRTTLFPYTTLFRSEQEEIFGPVLAVIKAQDYDDALKIANDTQHGLTGAVYSADEGKLKRARREFHVGNLYLRSEEHTSELQSHSDLVCRLLLEQKN